MLSKNAYYIGAVGLAGLAGYFFLKKKPEKKYNEPALSSTDSKKLAIARNYAPTEEDLKNDSPDFRSGLKDDDRAEGYKYGVYDAFKNYQWLGSHAVNTIEYIFSKDESKAYGFKPILKHIKDDIPQNRSFNKGYMEGLFKYFEGKAGYPNLSEKDESRFAILAPDGKLYVGKTSLGIYYFDEGYGDYLAKKDSGEKVYIKTRVNHAFLVNSTYSEDDIFEEDDGE